MKKLKKIRGQRSLSDDTLFLFLHTILVAKKKSSVQEILSRVKLKKETLRPIRILRILNNLKKDSYITIEHKLYPSVSHKGEVFLRMLQQKSKKHWDKRFRIVLFDNIQTSRNNLQYIRTKLKRYGFMPLTRGVFVYPYQCDAFLELLTLEYVLKKPLTFFVAQDNESLTRVRKYFKLR